MMTLLSGKTDQTWVVSEDSSCGLVLTGNAATDSEHQPMPAKTGPRVLALLLSQDDPEAGGVALSIRRPIRVMPLIDLLNEAGRRLAQQALTEPTFVRTQAVAAVPPSTPPVSPHVATALVLRELRQNPKTAQPTALMNNAGTAMAVVRVGPGTVTATLPLDELAKAMAQTFSESKPLALLPNVEARLKDVAPQSLDALCWKIGANLVNSVGLAPWLKTDVVYRLLGWPDFGAIGADRYGMKLSAAMLANAMSPIQLSEKTKVALQDVNSFFNSVSVSGLLSEVVDSALRPAPVSTAPAPVNAPRRSMFSMLRSKLGLS